MPGKNPKMGKTLWSILIIIISNVQQSERVQKFKVDLPNQSQNNPIKSTVKFNPNKKVNIGQSSKKMSLKQLGHTKSKSA